MERSPFGQLNLTVIFCSSRNLNGLKFPGKTYVQLTMKIKKVTLKRRSSEARSRRDRCFH